jgi:hypothetical protein
MRKNNVVAELFLFSILYVLFEIYPGNIIIMHTAVDCSLRVLRLDIAEILLKIGAKHNQSINKINQPKYVFSS